MSYLWLKAAHIVTVLVWVATLITNAWLLRHARVAAVPRNGAHQELLRDWKAWDRRVGSPAMLLVWILGLTAATTGHWWPTLWLRAKFLLVFVLSALHGVYAGQMRRCAEDPDFTPRTLPTGAWIALLAVVVALVVLKPTL